MDDETSSIGDRREEVIGFDDREFGSRGFLVIDGPARGPAVGACRSRPYEEEDRALADALRQARTTSLKAAIAGLPLAGGCAVTLEEEAAGSSVRPSLAAVARAVDRLGGRYVLLPDLQGHFRTLDEAAAVTSHVLGRSDEALREAIDATATGLRIGIETAVRRRLGRDGLMGVRVAILGLGEIGFSLAEQLRQAGARLTVADRDPRRTERAVRELGISCVTSEEIVHLDVDVLAPTAAKDTIDDRMLSHLRCAIVAGAVDDVLKSPALAKALHDRDILFLPDTVINAGGLISLVRPLLTEDSAQTSIMNELEAIGRRLERVIDHARDEGLPTTVIAERMAEDASAGRSAAIPAQARAS